MPASVPDALFGGRGRAAPPLVLAERVAARLDGRGFGAFTQDAGAWATGLGSIARLLGCRVAAGGWWGAAAEAAGATLDDTADPPRIGLGGALTTPRDTPRWRAFTGALDRLAAADRASQPLVAVLPGPSLLAATVCGDAADAALAAIKDVSVALVDAVCRRRPDVLLLAEGAALAARGVGSPERRAHNTLRNVARYYDVPAGLLLGAHEPGLLAALPKLAPDCVLFTADATGALPSIDALATLPAEIDGIGVPVDLGDAAAAATRHAAARERLAGRRWILNASGELPPEVDLAALRQCCDRLAAA